MQNHLIYIFWISLISGFFGGVINFLQLDDDEYSWSKFLKSTFVGIGAAYVVPLFLQTISSDLITQCEEDGKYYFVYAGFCLIASIFSRRFLNTVADAVIKKAEDAEKKADIAIETANQNEEKVSAIVDKNSEPENTLTNEHIEYINEDLQGKLKSDVGKVIQVFKESKYTYRTANGIAKDIESDILVIDMILQELERAGFIKKFISKSNKTLWSLTEKGNLYK